jgi:hypothetical protein
VGTSVEQRRKLLWNNVIGLLVSLLAAVVILLPFAAHTSPWNAVTLRVPGNQGNLWHLLIGAPFFLAFEMIWLRLRSILLPRSATPAGRRLVWILVALSAGGTITVEIPFVLRLGNFAHMAINHQLSAVGSGLGPMAVCGAILLLRRRHISPISACFLGLNGAWLSNAALCLLFYAPMREPGWTGTMIVGWFMGLEIVWILLQSFRTPSAERLSFRTKIDPLTTT